MASDCRYATYFRPRLVAAKKEGYTGHADTPGTCAPTPTAATAADEVGGSMNAVVGGALNAVVGGAASSGSASSTTSSAASSAAVPAVRADLRRDEAIITTLAQLFIKRPSEWTVR